MNIFSVTCITLLIFLALFAIFVFFVISSNKTSRKAKTIEKKETKISSVPKKVTFWTDWKTYLMFFLVYVLWGIGQTLLITKGGPFHPAIAPLPSGMLYLPYSGILYAILFATFFYLGILSVNPMILVFSCFFGFICVIASIWGFWFVPYSVPHMVYIPALHYVGITGILFPPDPIVSWVWIVIGIVSLFIFVMVIGRKEDDFYRPLIVIIMITSVSIFLPQFFHLYPDGKFITCGIVAVLIFFGMLLE